MSAPSYWLHTLGPVTRRPPPAGDRDADVAIVGGGYTGLWTAYYLSQAAPSLKIVVLEAEYCGFGASGVSPAASWPLKVQPEGST